MPSLSIPFRLLLYLVILSSTLAFWAWNDWQFRFRKLQAAEREARGLRYSFRERLYKGKRIALSISIAVPRGLRFALRREGGFDVFGKRLGLAVEPQTGDPAFDRAFYFDTTDPVIRRLLQDKAMRDRLRCLPLRMEAHGGRLRRLYCEEGELHVEVKTKGGEASTLEAEVVESLAPVIAEILERWPKGFADEPPLDRAHQVRVAYLVPWVVGTLIAPLLLSLSFATLIAPAAVWKSGLAVAGALFLVFLAWAFWYVGPTSKRHRVLLECLLMGLPGWVLATVFVVRTVDVHFDTGRAERVVITSPSVHAYSVRRSGMRYSLGFYSSHPLLAEVHSCPLDAATFRRLQAAWGDARPETAVLLLHPGALGHPWIAGAETLPSPAAAAAAP
jgi:hypothetical protein